MVPKVPATAPKQARTKEVGRSWKAPASLLWALADTTAKWRNEIYPARIFNRNCGTVFCTIYNAWVDSSEKQALTNILRVLHQWKLQIAEFAEGNIKSEARQVWFVFISLFFFLVFLGVVVVIFFFCWSRKNKCIAKQTVSNSQRLIALLLFSFMSSTIATKSS